MPTKILTRALQTLLLVSTAGATAVAADVLPSWEKGRRELEERVARPRNGAEARNLILFIGDGNGVNSVTATRIFAGQERGRTGEEFNLSYDEMPYAALIKTYNTDAQVSDSAGTATALLSGAKTRAGVIGVDANLERGDCAGVASHRLKSLFDIAREEGRARGIVTTTRITHATPAAAYAASADRNFESDSLLPEGCEGQLDIAAQLGPAEFDFAMGGGQAVFLPKTMKTTDGKPGLRNDGQDLIDGIRKSGVQVVTDGDGFRGLSPDGQTRVLGLFGADHMDFEADRTHEPSLAEMTEAAIRHLEATGKRWILLVEAGRIDHGHHMTNPHRALKDGVAFSEAVAAARRVSGENTLIVVTADHAHTLSIQGYPRRGSPITGFCETIGSDDDPQPCLDREGRPYPTLAYANGLRNPPTVAILPPGKEADESQGSPAKERPETETIGSPNFLVETLIPQIVETHGGSDVAAYAEGPRAYLVSGTMEQNTLFHILAYAGGLPTSPQK